MALLSGPLACSSEGNVNIGNTQRVGSQLADYAGVWTGYAQAFAFDDGSDHVQLTVDGTGHGTVRFGTSAPPPAPSDPHVGYPPKSSGTSLFPGRSGFAYSLHGTQVDTDRMQFGIDFNDLYATWCALQTPVPAMNVGTDFYYCGPPLTSAVASVGSDSADAVDCKLVEQDGTTETVNCEWFNLCAIGPVCSCTSASCTTMAVPDGSPLAQYSAELDGALSGDGGTLIGTLTWSGNQRVTVILQKN